MEKLLYFTWRGPSRRESNRGVEEQEERIEERRKTRVKVDANITVSHPNADDFSRWMRTKGDDDTAGKNPDQ